MSGLHKAKKSKKNRKHGRNAIRCTRYAASHQQERNQLRKLVKRLKDHPKDKTALTAVRSCKLVLGLV